ncbi:unnamed protein product [Oikopleura dioica]|uniref:Uncharacterized protein n=1 Tax=Oikopleura dioica TaxID=34765 RepID=E4Y662_OIKDI|nr:unnamed protein product [Oikopleura dioica]
MHADLATAIHAIDATLDQNRKATMSDSDLRMKICEKMQDVVFEFEGLPTLSLIVNYMQADENLTNFQRNMQNDPSRQAKGFYREDEKRNYRHEESDHYPQQPRHLREEEKYDYTNPDPSERNLSSNREISSYGNKDVDSKKAGIYLNEYSFGDNRVAALYQDDIERKKSFSKSETEIQVPTNYQGMQSSSQSADDKDEKRSSSEKIRVMACNFDKAKTTKDAMTSGESFYWPKSQKIKKDRFYLMPIIDMADLSKLKSVNGIGAQFAHQELFQREAGLPPNSIGKRYLFFATDSKLMTQIDLYEHDVGQKIEKQPGQSTMFTNFRSIREIQGKG